MLKVLKVLLVAAMPISELRGAIPLAIYFGYSPVKAYIISLVGNVIPIPFLLLSLYKIRELAGKYTFTSKIINAFEKRALKNKKLIEKYGYLGLTVFVAVPLPITGAWTACLLSTLLELKPEKAFAYIFVGVAIAGLIVLSSVLGVLSLSAFLP